MTIRIYPFDMNKTTQPAGGGALELGSPGTSFLDILQSLFLRFGFRLDHEGVYVHPGPPELCAYVGTKTPSVAITLVGKRVVYASNNADLQQVEQILLAYVKLRPPCHGHYGSVHVEDLGTRYIVTMPEPNEEYLREWRALNVRYGLRSGNTRAFVTKLDDSSH